MSGISRDFPSTEPPRAKRRWPAALDLGCRCALAVVFLMAGVSKVTDLRGFEDQVILHTPLPIEVGLLVAHFLPWLELTCGACLALGRAVREAALLTGVLLLLFLVYGLLYRGDADCGCFLFPVLREVQAPWWLPARDLVLFLCSVRLIVRPVRGA